MEVDLNLHADGGFAVLHDEDLDRETTGTGPVRSATIDQLRKCRLRSNTGTATDAPVMLDEDLALAIKGNVRSGALVQLDIKQNYSEMGPTYAKRLVDTFSPLSANIIVSTSCKELLKYLTIHTPEMRLGYDPTSAILECIRAGKFKTETDAMLFLAPIITGTDGLPYNTVYLNYRLLIASAELGIDLVEICHRNGSLVDAWTLDCDDSNAAANLRHLVALGVDQITSNTVPDLIELYGGHGQKKAI